MDIENCKEMKVCVQKREVRIKRTWSDNGFVSELILRTSLKLYVFVVERAVAGLQQQKKLRRLTRRSHPRYGERARGGEDDTRSIITRFLLLLATI